MKIGQQLEKMRAALADWARGNGGTIAIASDPVHLWHLLSAAPGGVRGVLLFDAEEVRGEIGELGRVDRKFILVISRGRGFNAERSDALTKGSGGGKALFDLVEEAREVLRSLEVENADDIDEVTLNYSRTSRFDPGDLILDTYQIEFQCPAQLPEQSD